MTSISGVCEKSLCSDGVCEGSNDYYTGSEIQEISEEITKKVRRTQYEFPFRYNIAWRFSCYYSLILTNAHCQFGSLQIIT